MAWATRDTQVDHRRWLLLLPPLLLPPLLLLLSMRSSDCEAVHSFPAWSFLLLMHLLSLPWWFSAIHIRARAQNCGVRPAFAAENIH